MNLKQPKLQIVHDLFKILEINYIHFSLVDFPHDFLYVVQKDYSKYSIFYGTDFRSLIPKFKKDLSLDCLECKLGMNILGGVSFDDGEFVDFNLTITQANQILKEIDSSIKIKEFQIKFFKNEEEM